MVEYISKLEKPIRIKTIYTDNMFDPPGSWSEPIKKTTQDIADKVFKNYSKQIDSTEIIRTAVRYSSNCMTTYPFDSIAIVIPTKKIWGRTISSKKETIFLLEERVFEDSDGIMAIGAHLSPNSLNLDFEELVKPYLDELAKNLNTGRIYLRKGNLSSLMNDFDESAIKPYG